jgi:hypothetical protein
MKTGLERIGRNFTPETANRMCLDKRKFDSRNEARDFAIRGRKLFGNSSTSSYKCNLCNGFHLTSLKKADSAAVKRINWRKVI